LRELGERCESREDIRRDVTLELSLQKELMERDSMISVLRGENEQLT
jgi:hypothetical protein